MDEPSQPEAVGSVKAAISFYGERIRSRKQEKLNSQIFPQEVLACAIFDEFVAI